MTPFLQALATFFAFVAWSFCSSHAFALSCGPIYHDESQAKSWFGTSKLVFVGKLTGFVGKPRFEGWHESVQGIFAVEQTFKGAAEPQRIVRINANHIKDNRYLIYATDDKGELRADAACHQRLVPMTAQENVRAHLAYLTNLPKARNGGELSLSWGGLYRETDFKRRAGFQLDLVGKGQTVKLITDAGGRAQQQGIEEGAYRVTTIAPQGYRFECGGERCDQIYIHDRGRTELDVRAVPIATLSIAVQDSNGTPVSLRAEFNVYEAISGRLIGSFAESSSYLFINNAPYAATEKIVPGEYVLGLVLTDAKSAGVACTINLRQKVVFDEGANDVKSARRVSIKLGENSYSFRLPRALSPVRTQLVLNGYGERSDPLLELNLVVAEGCGTANARYHFGRPQGHPDKLAFWSIPGQTLNLGVFGYELKGGKFGAIRIQPKKNDTLQVTISKRSW